MATSKPLWGGDWLRLRERAGTERRGARVSLYFFMVMGHFELHHVGEY